MQFVIVLPDLIHQKLDVDGLADESFAQEAVKRPGCYR